jgi:hypothetical protein
MRMCPAQTRAWIGITEAARAERDGAHAAGRRNPMRAAAIQSLWERPVSDRVPPPWLDGSKPDPGPHTAVRPDFRPARMKGRRPAASSKDPGHRTGHVGGRDC